MRNDLDMIVKKFPVSQKELHIYALGDIHVGSPEYDSEAVQKKLQIIKDDPVGVVCICGDLADYGLKNSKSNVYFQTMDPAEQQRFVYELLEPIKDKIVSLVPGNHEFRITKEVGLCPLYDIAVRLGIEDVYRENVAILKVSFGKRRGGPSPNTFVGITTHGSSRNKHQKHVACYDGIDWCISGHTHQPMYVPHAKIRINSQKESVILAPYKEIVVDANLKPGGYGIKHEYEIPAKPELQYLELKTRRNGTGVQKIINYHTIQL